VLPRSLSPSRPCAEEVAAGEVIGGRATLSGLPLYSALEFGRIVQRVILQQVANADR